MILRWIGAVLIMSGCAASAISLTGTQKKQNRMLCQLERILYEMEWELQYRLTPLPALCANAARTVTGVLRELLTDLSNRLEDQVEADPGGCMNGVLQHYPGLPGPVRKLLKNMGLTMGNYDLEGQIQGLRVLRAECHHVLEEQRCDLKLRLRSVRTVAMCTGAALVILFI